MDVVGGDDVGLGVLRNVGALAFLQCLASGRLQTALPSQAVHAGPPERRGQFVSRR